MGKRELLLIGGFVLFGVIVYYATAPAAAPDQGRFTVGKLLEDIRREIHGDPGSAEAKSSKILALDKNITELRIEIGSAALTIVGEHRADLASDMSVRSTGYDDAEAA